jgi:hypothetical protein
MPSHQIPVQSATQSGTGKRQSSDTLKIGNASHPPVCGPARVQQNPALRIGAILISQVPIHKRKPKWRQNDPVCKQWLLSPLALFAPSSNRICSDRCGSFPAAALNSQILIEAPALRHYNFRDYVPEVRGSEKAVNVWAFARC